VAVAQKFLVSRDFHNEIFSKVHAKEAFCFPSCRLQYCHTSGFRNLACVQTSFSSNCCSRYVWMQRKRAVDGCAIMMQKAALGNKMYHFEPPEGLKKQRKRSKKNPSSAMSAYQISGVDMNFFVRENACFVYRYA